MARQFPATSLGNAQIGHSRVRHTRYPHTRIVAQWLHSGKYPVILLLWVLLYLQLYKGMWRWAGPWIRCTPQVEFSAKHMGITTVKGAFTGVSAAIDFNQDDFVASSVAAAPDATGTNHQAVMILPT
jgi:hypothetical protein